MKVWYIAQVHSDIECGESEKHILFSTQEKAEEKFMELVDSKKDIFDNYENWVLDEMPFRKMFYASADNHDPCSCKTLSVGSYEIDSGNILEW